MRTKIARARALGLAMLVVTMCLSPARAGAQAAPGAPDPTRLPVATTEQASQTSAYDALAVPAIPAGGSYLDPTTGVRIHKLTSSSFPATGSSWTHDYAEGGNEVSLPYTGDGVTRAVLVRAEASGPYYLIDVVPGVSVGNARPLTGDLEPNIELAFTFSSNPATPYYAYVGGVNGIRRVDIRTLTEAPGDGWPLPGETNAIWLHQSELDAFFVWMRGATGPTVVGYEPASGTLKTHTDPGADEPRIDRAGRYVGLSMNTPNNGLKVWDWQIDAITWMTDGDPGIPFAHGASLKHRWIVSDFNTNRTFGLFTPPVPNSGTELPGPIAGSTAYVNGNWLQSPSDLDDQWALTYFYGGLQPDGPGWLAPGGMVFMTANGERRLLAHAYNTTATYGYYTYGKSSSDGAVVLFNSDMHGSGRSDVFLAEVPRAPATGALLSIRTPRPGSTVKGTIEVVALRRAVSVAAVAFTVDGHPAGVVRHRVPSILQLDTRTLVNGPHTIVATALNAMMRPLGSATLTVLVANPAPRVRIEAPRAGATVTGAVRIATSLVHPDNVAVLEFRLDGVVVGRVTRPPATLVWDTRTRPNGSHTLQAVATTYAGATIVSDPVTVKVSNPLPTLKITSPKIGTTVKATIDVGVAMTSTDNIASVRLLVDGVDAGAVLSRPGVWRLNTTAVAPGTHALTVAATTRSGAPVVSAAVAVSVKR